jgi:RNA polymerase sigma-70 factor, ECF subfamily
MAKPGDGSASSKYSPLQLHTLGDLELVAALREGQNDDALAVLFERHSGLVFHIAKNIVKDDWEAEETVQQVFFDLYRAIKQFDPGRGSFKTWMLQFAYHRSINRREHLLCNKFYNWGELNDAVVGQILGANRPLAQLSPQETTRFIDQILGTLKPAQRRVIELTYFDGLTAEEIASKIGETAVTVRNHLYRGLAKLRCALIEGTRATQPVNAQRKGEQEGMLVAPARLL